MTTSRFSRRPDKAAIEKMKEQVLETLVTLRPFIPPEHAPQEALATLETFTDIALRIMAQTNTSKVIEVMRTVEIKARMEGKQVFE